MSDRAPGGGSRPERRFVGRPARRRARGRGRAPGPGRGGGGRGDRAALRRAEVERARREPTGGLDAHDLHLPALPHAFAYEPEDNAGAPRLLDRALGYAVARAHKAWLHGQRHVRGWSPDAAAGAADRPAAGQAARRTVADGVVDPAALAVAGVVLALIAGDHAAGLAALHRARAPNPGSAMARGFGATVSCFAAGYPAAVAHAERALRLSPLDPMRYHPLVALARASLFSGRQDDAPSATRAPRSRLTPASTRGTAS